MCFIEKKLFCGLFKIALIFYKREKSGDFSNKLILKIKSNNNTYIWQSVENLFLIIKNITKGTYT